MLDRARPAGMRRRRGPLRLALAVAVSAAAILGSSFALADTGTIVVDCVEPMPVEKVVASADLVFVGTVTAVDNGGRTATVTVTELWKGDVPTPVILNGGQNPATQGPDDRVFDVGATYLFVPTMVDGALLDSACSSTVPWSDDLARLRPQDIGQPLRTTPASPGPLAFLGWLGGLLAMVGLIGGGAIALSLLTARRRDS